MWLRVITTALLVLGIGLVVAMPWVAPLPAKGVPTEIVRAMVPRTMGYFMLTLAVWVAVAIGAILVAHQTWRSLHAEQRALLDGVVEASSRDHAKR